MFFGKSIMDNPICCICDGVCETLTGNNPRPYKKEGRCCSQCNNKFVLPARIARMFKQKPNIARLRLAVSRELQRNGIHCFKCKSCIDSQLIPLQLTEKEQKQTIKPLTLEKMLNAYNYAMDNITKRLCSYHTKLERVFCDDDNFLPDGVHIKKKRNLTQFLIKKYFNGCCTTCHRQPDPKAPHLGFYLNHKISKYDEEYKTNPDEKKKYNISYFFIDFGSIYGCKTAKANQECLDMPFEEASKLIKQEILKCDYQCSPCHHLITMNQKSTAGSHSLDWTIMKQQIQAELNGM